jgi:tetratricopeptide (TPR) repeat protein
MGDLHLGLGHGEQALEFYEKSLDLREELHRRNPNSADFARDLSVSYERMGDLMLGWRRFEEAKTHYQRSLTIREGLALRSPQSADFARDVAVGFWHLGDLAEKSGAPDVQDLWRKTFEKLDHMKRRGILPASDEQDYQQVRQKAGIEN